MDDKHAENDRYLIEACVKRDAAAWSNLIKKYSSLVCIVIKNRLQKYSIPVSTHDIEDIKQDIFTDIWDNNKLEGITNRDNISYWIAVMAGNAALARYRKKSARQGLKAVSLDDLLPSQASGSGPKDELTKVEIRAKIDEVIETLPEKEKLIIKLHLMDDKKYHDIADILGIPKGTVSSYIKRAKEKLREALKNF